MDDPQLWVNLANTFPRDSFYYDLGYHLLNATSWRHITDDFRKALSRIAGDDVTATQWASEAWRIRQFRRLLATKPTLKVSATEFVPFSKRNANETNALLREAVGQRAGGKRRRSRRRTRRS